MSVFYWICPMRIAREAMVAFFVAWVSISWSSLAIADNVDDLSQRFVEKHDQNDDGFLTKDELPEKMQNVFDRVDDNHDGKISVAEDTAFRRRAMQRSKPAGELPERTRILKDQAYVEEGHERQKLDLYLPAEMKTPQPLIVWIHGGAWRAGNKNGCPAKRFVAEG